MSGLVTFIDSIETQPIKGTVMRFRASTGDDTQWFSMERCTAIKTALDIFAEIERADLAELGGEVVPFVGRS